MCVNYTHHLSRDCDVLSLLCLFSFSLLIFFFFSFNFIYYFPSQSHHENHRTQKYFIGYCLSQKEFEDEFCASDTPQAKDKTNYNFKQLKHQEFLEEEDIQALKLSIGFNPQK